MQLQIENKDKKHFPVIGYIFAWKKGQNIRDKNDRSIKNKMTLKKNIDFRNNQTCDYTFSFRLANIGRSPKPPFCHV